MTHKPLILVTGATGAQGGSVAHHLFTSGQFRVRALTRHPYGAKAKDLLAKGAEVVSGNLTHKDRLYTPYREGTVRRSRSLYPALKTFEQQLAEDKEALSAVL